MPDLSNPHDRFFKEVFSRQEVAEDFLRNYLPQEVFDCLVPESLNLTKDSFVDKELGAYYSDLLYQIDLRDGSDSYVYVLFEHKSYPESLISFHLLRYMVKIWEQHLKQKMSGNLPIIIPIVIYHGTVKWKASKNFIGLFKCPEELERFLPDFSHVLCDISGFRDEEIKGIMTLKATLLLLKYILRDELRDRLPAILGLLKELISKKTGMEYLETVLTYLVRGTDRVDEEDMRRAMEEVLPLTGGEIMPTIAEKWIEQGVQQGVQQGIQQGILQTSRESVIEALEVRFDAVTQSVLKRLEDIDDPNVLKMLHKRALRVGSLQEFQDAMDFVLK
jgi:predicted transposase/invertase (TIGR01784 family)